MSVVNPPLLLREMKEELVTYGGRKGANSKLNSFDIGFLLGTVKVTV